MRRAVARVAAMALGVFDLGIDAGDGGDRGARPTETEAETETEPPSPWSPTPGRA